eukprot:1440372-Amphidinium_carterae.1
MSSIRDIWDSARVFWHCSLPGVGQCKVLGAKHQTRQDNEPIMHRCVGACLAFPPWDIAEPHATEVCHYTLFCSSLLCVAPSLCCIATVREFIIS